MIFPEAHTSTEVISSSMYFFAFAAVKAIAIGSVHPIAGFNSDFNISQYKLYVVLSITFTSCIIVPRNR